MIHIVNVHPARGTTNDYALITLRHDHTVQRGLRTAPAPAFRVKVQFAGHNNTFVYAEVIPVEQTEEQRAASQFEVEARLPPNIVTGHIVVTEDGGSADTATTEQMFQVEHEVDLAINSMRPNPARVGDRLTITGSKAWPRPVKVCIPVNHGPANQPVVNPPIVRDNQIIVVIPEHATTGTPMVIANGKSIKTTRTLRIE